MHLFSTPITGTAGFVTLVVIKPFLLNQVACPGRVTYTASDKVFKRYIDNVLFVLVLLVALRILFKNIICFQEDFFAYQSRVVSRNNLSI